MMHHGVRTSSIGIYGFVLWMPTIVRQGGGLSIQVTGILSAITYLAAVFLMLGVSHISDRSLKREALDWPFLLAAGLALLGSFLLSGKSFVFGFVAWLLREPVCMRLMVRSLR